ncbi:unnamed protein product [Anisakis simplex]|uniref:Uncharacterized protein n=1 Tax=Anisakis simplex TaxID=6269 RepID=A0A3P6NNA0_ANISI|nr:unnamed protein product [Anisakis simplex]
MQAKSRAQKKLADEAELLANANLMKYRQLNAALESVEHRASNAENGLQRIRSKQRIVDTTTTKTLNQIKNSPSFDNHSVLFAAEGDEEKPSLHNF